MATDKVGLFGDVLRFSPPYFCIALLAAALFSFHWWLTFKKTGWKIDYWHYTVLMNVFIPIILLYPFSGSILQMAAVGLSFYQIDPWIDEAFAISLFGYGCLLLGRLTFDAMGRERAAGLIRVFFGIIETATYRNIRSGAASLLLAALVVPLFAAVFYIAGASSGFKIGRYFLEEDPSFRGLYNMLTFVYPLLPMYFWLRNRARMSRMKWLLFAVLVFATLLLGTRTAIVSTVLTCYLFNALANRGAISFTRGALLFFGIIVLSLGFSAIRSGGSPADALLTLWTGVFYGNGVSDLRDFAWGLSAWNGDFWLGKTYLAGLMGFVPRVLSSFREQWAIGVVTAQLAGFLPTEHAGIRLGIFGEAYMNFGLIGVLFLGFVNGFTLRYADAEIKERVACGRDLVFAYAATIPYQITSAFYISTSLSLVYTFLGVQVVALILRICLVPISRPGYRPA